jgi:hypothetical protein
LLRRLGATLKSATPQKANDYAGERFKGADLAYVTAEINRARLERQLARTAEHATVDTPTAEAQA